MLIQAARTGTTSLVALALMTAGEKPGSPTIQRTLQIPEAIRPDQLNSTYASSLQTMVFAAAEPDSRPEPNPGERGIPRAAARSSWATEGPGRGPGTISTCRCNPGDNSNTQYALLGLNAAREAGADDPARGMGAYAQRISSYPRIATAAGAIRPGTSSRLQA